MLKPNNLDSKIYKLVDLQIIALLKEMGYKNVRLILQSSDNRQQATVEVIPERENCIGLDLISLNSAEILDYFDGPSAMARYVIRRDFFCNGKLRVES